MRAAMQHVTAEANVVAVMAAVVAVTVATEEIVLKVAVKTAMRDAQKVVTASDVNAIQSNALLNLVATSVTTSVVSQEESRGQKARSHARHAHLVSPANHEKARVKSVRAANVASEPTETANSAHRWMLQSKTWL